MDTSRSLRSTLPAGLEAAPRDHRLPAKTALAALSLGLMLALPAFAQPDSPAAGEPADRRSEVGFTFGTGYSDNLFKTNPPDSGNYTGLGVELDVNRQSRRLRAFALGSVEYRDYSHALVEDEPYGDLQAEFEIQAVPDIFSWLTTDYYFEGREDALSPSGPGNREQINVFETGPVVRLPVGGRMELRLQSMAGWRNVNSRQAYDNDFLRSTAGFYRVLSPTAEVGLSVIRNDIEYDAPPIENVIDTAFLAYNKEFSTGRASFAVGTTSVDMGPTEGEDRPYVNISWQRDVGARSNLEFSIVNELIDLSDSYRGRSLDDVLLTIDVYERSSVGVAAAPPKVDA